MAQFFGKYRGIVSDNQDPLRTGRIKARVPDVYGDKESGWALPCMPFGGKSQGFFGLPDKDAKVWIEFEHGDPDYPIWTGVFWGNVSEMPTVLLPMPEQKLFISTKGGTTLLLDDTPGVGGIKLETPGGQKLVISAKGIEIANGMNASIKLTGPQISLNDGALEIT